MNNIKVSVIIPVFNTALFLKEAINSILNQTLEEIEIITVNDGSSDNSLAILKDLAISDKRIRVISYEKNVGVSVCRNTGMEKAKGEFVYFFDSDDILEKDCIEVCYSKMKSNTYDFIIFDGVSFYEDGIKPTFHGNYERTRLLVQNSYSGVMLAHLLISQKNYSCSVCLCFIRKKYLDNIGLKFHPGVLYEDVLFTIQLYLAAHEVSFIPRSFFRRRVRANSTMTTFVSQKNIDYRLIVGHEILQQKTKYPNKLSKSLLNHQARNLFIYLLKTLIKSGQYSLLIKNSFKILKLIVRSLFLNNH